MLRKSLFFSGGQTIRTSLPILPDASPPCEPALMPNGCFSTTDIRTATTANTKLFRVSITYTQQSQPLGRSSSGRNRSSGRPVPCNLLQAQKKRREESFLILSFRRFSLYKVTEPRRSRRHQFSNFSSPFSTSIRIGFSRSISPARIRFDRSLTM